jgi:hypothetical protein
MEVISFRDAPAGSKYIAEMDVYHNRTFYRRIRLIVSQKGNMFVNMPSYGEDDGNGGKKWIQYWEWSKDEDALFKKYCLEAAKPFLNINSPGVSRAKQDQYQPPQYTPQAQKEFQPDLGDCPF